MYKKIGFIYKIFSDIGPLIYIGSTINDLNKRMAIHIYQYNHNKINNLSLFKLFDLYGIENCKIELIENFYFILKKEFLLREKFYLELFENNIINKNITGRTRTEVLKCYYLKNRNILIKKMKDYQNKKNLNKKCICDICFGKFTLLNKRLHLQTKKHKNFLLSKYINE